MTGSVGIKRRRIRARERAVPLLLALMLAMLPLLAGQRTGAQEAATPEATSPAPSSLPAVAAPDILAGAPHLQVLAQGVVDIEGPAVWRVREMPVSSSGAPEAPPDSFALQRRGATVVRNELTGRRVRLEPGEARFMPKGDPVLFTAVGTDASLVWLIELLPGDAADGNAYLTGTQVYESDATNEYPRGTFEVELARDVLLPGEVSLLPPTTGPALVLATSGQVEVARDGGQVVLLQAGQGQLVTGSATFRNTTTEAAGFVVAALGEPVTGAETAATPGQGDSSLPLPQSNAAELPPVEVLEVVPVQPAPIPTVPPAPPAVPTVAPEPDLGLVDTDGDKIADVDEIGIYGTDPYAWDTDGDGLGDGEEAFGFGTDPLRWDTDGDGVSDGDEVHVYGTNPVDPASGP